MGCTKEKEPSDKEMIDNFNSNEIAFETIKDIVSKYKLGKHESFHYPLFEGTDDSLSVNMSNDEKFLLDSLLNKIGV